MQVKRAELEAGLQCFRARNQIDLCAHWLQLLYVERELYGTRATIVQTTEVHSLEQWPLIGILLWLGEGEGLGFLFYTLMEAWLAVMLSFKLLTTQAAGIKLLYFTWCDVNHQWPAMAELYPELCVLERNWMPKPGSSRPKLMRIRSNNTGLNPRLFGAEARARRIWKNFLADCCSKYCGSGSTCFWASRIRIH